MLCQWRLQAQCPARTFPPAPVPARPHPPEPPRSRRVWPHTPGARASTNTSPPADRTGASSVSPRRPRWPGGTPRRRPRSTRNMQRRCGRLARRGPRRHRWGLKSRGLRPQEVDRALRCPRCPRQGESTQNRAAQTPHRPLALSCLEYPPDLTMEGPKREAPAPRPQAPTPARALGAPGSNRTARSSPSPGSEAPRARRLLRWSQPAAWPRAAVPAARTVKAPAPAQALGAPRSNRTARSSHSPGSEAPRARLLLRRSQPAAWPRAAGPAARTVKAPAPARALGDPGSNRTARSSPSPGSEARSHLATWPQAAGPVVQMALEPGSTMATQARAPQRVPVKALPELRERALRTR